ncbi:MAG: protein phosphatase [Pseudomonadota bacterium]
MDEAKRGAMSNFVIYALPVANGILGIAPLPGRGGHRNADLAHLRDWKPALVLSMTTASEMDMNGARDLGSELQDAGTRWFHVPVVDLGVPEAQVLSDWALAEEAALTALRGGGRVLIHCLGGCGRSGMAALRLMIAEGEPPDGALARLRAVRPCAVETGDQLDWARVARGTTMPRPS